MSFERIKYLRINPTKDDKNIYTETYKFPKGYKGGRLKKIEILEESRYLRFQILLNIFLSKWISRCNTILSICVCALV